MKFNIKYYQKFIQYLNIKHTLVFHFSFYFFTLIVKIMFQCFKSKVKTRELVLVPTYFVIGPYLIAKKVYFVPPFSYFLFSIISLTHSLHPPPSTHLIPHNSTLLPPQSRNHHHHQPPLCGTTTLSNLLHIAPPPVPTITVAQSPCSSATSTHAIYIFEALWVQLLSTITVSSCTSTTVHSFTITKSHSTWIFARMESCFHSIYFSHPHLIQRNRDSIVLKGCRKI